MYKIAIVDKMHEDGIRLLKNNPKFKCEIIEDLSKKNLFAIICLSHHALNLELQCITK